MAERIGRVLRFPERPKPPQPKRRVTVPMRVPASGVSMLYTVNVDELTDALVKAIERYEREQRG